jgi:hypothetical protein
MKQISAVEWLVKQISYLTSYGTIITHHKDITELVEQAKEMEKEHIEQAFNEGDLFSHNYDESGEKYYIYTFEK